ncbi:MAG TPA: nuclear transport factor 2 family protein [Solirubrobacterales bacterium]|jgi:ketosteroid isomerase-like protein|nr:nuclear transport factor 2 family protein [Solirubrobacterales bacterium]
MAGNPDRLALIVRYYDACSRADFDGMMATLTEDATHYFLMPNPGSQAIRGGRTLAAFWQKIQARFDARWIVDSIVAEGDRAAIEWTIFWTPNRVSPRVASRGAEFYEFRDDRIAEIRAYYHQDPELVTELRGFDYEGRGFSLLGRESSSITRDR